PFSEWGPAVEGATIKYPYEVRRADDLMTDAGFSKGPDGIYASPTQGRLSAELQTNAAADNSSEQSILASTWRQAGFDIQEMILPAALAQDAQYRATYSAM